jgi:hypothetical protein
MRGSVPGNCLLTRKSRLGVQEQSEASSESVKAALAETGCIESNTLSSIFQD